ncbi:MAG: alanine racemase [Halocynthiibacter sp.]
MGTATLTIDLNAIAANWRALDRLSGATVQTAAVVKADGYGLGVGAVARTLAHAGARCFFVALAEEGGELRQILGPGPDICIFGGHMRGDTDMIADLDLTPMLNSLDQTTRHLEALPAAPFGIQLDTGMNRLGMEPGEWAALRDILALQTPRLVISHLACADTPDHAMNARQLSAFRDMTADFDAPRSLAATGGILLGADYHFELTRPGIGLYGGLPFSDAARVAGLSLPVIQTRDLAPGECVGYGCAWAATGPSTIATVAAGYADGVLRAAGSARLFAGATPCPVVGRISMDLITVDISHLSETPRTLDLLCEEQGVDDLAEASGTIGYEILTSLGRRYTRRHISGGLS